MLCLLLPFLLACPPKIVGPADSDSAVALDSVPDTGSDTAPLLETAGDTAGETAGDTALDTAPVDGDGDGFPADQDCDDGQASIHPGAEEACDGLDQDCDGLVDESCPTTCGDGFATGDESCDGADDSACPGLCSSWCGCPSAPAGDLRVLMVDVGQGDALLVVSPDGWVMLVDSGPSGSGGAIARALVELGLHGIDYTLLTHNHSDHMGSMGEVLRRWPEVAACYDHGHDDSDATFEDYAEEAGDRRVPLVEGDTVDLGPSTVVDVLHGWGRYDNENDNSLVIRVTYGDVSVLLGGDCESSECEPTLDPGPITLYKVHHHGASDATSQPLLDLIQPPLAFISVGEDNPYGHPEVATLTRLSRAGTTVYRTDQDGNLLFSSDGATFSVLAEVD